MRKFICNKENETQGMRKEKYTKKDKEEQFEEINAKNHNTKAIPPKNDEKYFIYKLQKNLGVSLEKFKIL